MELNDEQLHAMNLFCEDFAYKFVTTMSVEDVFAKLTGQEMQDIQNNLEGYLESNLETWIRNELHEDSI